MALISFAQWKKEHLGKYVKYNKSTKGYQCVDEIKSILVEVKHYDFYGKYPSLKNYWSFGNARDWFENYNSHKELKNAFNRIYNTAKFVPIENDILVFGEYNKNGHICVAYDNSSTTRKIYSIDQNYNPSGSPVKYCKHKYEKEEFLGVLRPYRYIKSDVNIRTAPSIKKGAVIGEYKKGTKISIIELDSTGKWAKTKDGWISYNYIEEI